MIYENGVAKTCDTKGCEEKAAFRTFDRCLCWMCYRIWCKREPPIAQELIDVKSRQLELF
jgi:hypothetical protein